MTDFSKKKQTEAYFTTILNKIGNTKIKAIFSMSAPLLDFHKGFRTYSTDTEIYILLENGYSLIISYPFIDCLDVQFRKLTQDEEDEYNHLSAKDWFNIINDIDDINIKKLEYGSITNICLRPVTKKYTKWLDNDTSFVEPTAETFDEIKFTMSNGKSFIICPDDAESDGYTFLWS